MVKYRIGWSWNNRSAAKPNVYYSLDSVRRELRYLKAANSNLGMTFWVEEKRGRNCEWHTVNVSE